MGIDKNSFRAALLGCSNINRLARRLALYLHDRMANQAGYCWPHMAHLMRALGCSKCGLIAALKELYRVGALQVIHRCKYRGNMYVLAWSEFWGQPEAVKSHFLGQPVKPVCKPRTVPETRPQTKAPPYIPEPNAVNPAAEPEQQAQLLRAAREQLHEYPKYFRQQWPDPDSGTCLRLLAAFGGDVRALGMWLLRLTRTRRTPGDTWGLLVYLATSQRSI